MLFFVFRSALALVLLLSIGCGSNSSGTKSNISDDPYFGTWHRPCSQVNDSSIISKIPFLFNTEELWVAETITIGIEYFQAEWLVYSDSECLNLAPETKKYDLGSQKSRIHDKQNLISDQGYSFYYYDIDRLIPVDFHYFFMGFYNVDDRLYKVNPVYDDGVVIFGPLGYKVDFDYYYEKN